MDLLEIEKLATDFLDLTFNEDEPMISWDKLWERRKLLKQQMVKHLLSDEDLPTTLVENLAKIEEQLRTHY